MYLFEISQDWTRQIWHFPLHTVLSGLIPLQRVPLPPELLKPNTWYLPLNHCPSHQVGPILVSKYLKCSTSPLLQNAKPWIKISIITPNLSHRMQSFSTTHSFFSVIACVCVCMCVCVHACTLSHFSCVWLFVTLWTVACHDPLWVNFKIKIKLCHILA